MTSPASSKKPVRPKRLHLRRIVGVSMMPTLRPGQLVWFAKRSQLRPDDIVMFEHDGLEKIKRVAELQADQLFVIGDNPAASRDSRVFGWIQSQAVRGTLVWPRVLSVRRRRPLLERFSRRRIV